MSGLSVRQPSAQRWKAPPELRDQLKPFAREMRSEPTRAEDALWQSLRGRRLGGLKFRRQHAVERFVVDFYCREARLVVEVDGEIHQDTREQDATRQTFLEQQGLLVLRVANREVQDSLTEVLAAISLVATRSAKAPLSAGRRGAGGEVVERP